MPNEKHCAHNNKNNSNNFFLQRLLLFSVCASLLFIVFGFQNERVSLARQLARNAFHKCVRFLATWISSIWSRQMYFVCLCKSFLSIQQPNSPSRSTRTDTHKHTQKERKRMKKKMPRCMCFFLPLNLIRFLFWCCLDFYSVHTYLCCSLLQFAYFIYDLNPMRKMYRNVNRLAHILFK